VIGQGGATDTAFVTLWGAIAKYYAKEPYVIFGLMNEISYGTSYAINSTTTFNLHEINLT
jgi:endoglucanase